MRSRGDVLLVACYEMGHQPVNLASPLGWLERAGYEAVAVDTSVESLDDETIRRAQLIAFSAPMHTALRLAMPIAARVRRLNPRAHLLFYGLYGWLNRDYLLAEAADSVIGGEYEAPLLALVEALEHGAPLTPIPGVASPQRSMPPFLDRLDFALPSRAALPSISEYAHLVEEDGVVPAGYVEASRGCLHTCRHCPITPVYGGRFFVIPREIVIEDIAVQVAAGARHITFGDPDFLNGPRHAMRLLREMHARFPFLTFDATIKVEHLLEHRDLLPELRRLGAAFVVSAIESFSDPLLEVLHKGHDAADAIEAIALTRAAGITLRPSLMPFTPWTTLSDYLHLLHTVEEHDLVAQVDPVQYSIRLLLPPGSALLPEGPAPAWLGALDPVGLSYLWRHPDPRMDRLQSEVHRLVEECAARGASAAETFYRISVRAHQMAGRPVPERRERSPRFAPGLTEAWFC